MYSRTFRPPSGLQLSDCSGAKHSGCSLHLSCKCEIPVILRKEVASAESVQIHLRHMDGAEEQAGCGPVLCMERLLAAVCRNGLGRRELGDRLGLGQ